MFLKDCVKGLKHLFNRYGYVSPQFTEAHQHGAGYPHEHVVDKVDPGALVSTLQADGAGQNNDTNGTLS